MNNHAAIFRQQLQTSADGLIYAVEQLPTGRLFVTPYPQFGVWSAARIVFHVTFHDRMVISPYITAWSNEEFPDYEHVASLGDREEENWRSAGSRQDLHALLVDFRLARDDLLQLLDLTTDDQWDAIRETVWGNVPLRWLFLKTYQHTIEHSDTLLKMMLFWDMYLLSEKSRRQSDDG